MSGAKIIEALKQAIQGDYSRVEMGAHAWVRVDFNVRHARNSAAWALGYMHKGRFQVRRIVWGRLMARSEKREGEVIRRATILITGPIR